jgi:hypothetical protein
VREWAALGKMRAQGWLENRRKEFKAPAAVPDRCPGTFRRPLELRPRGEGAFALELPRKQFVSLWRRSRRHADEQRHQILAAHILLPGHALALRSDGAGERIAEAGPGVFRSSHRCCSNFRVGRCQQVAGPLRLPSCDRVRDPRAVEQELARQTAYFEGL